MTSETWLLATFFCVVFGSIAAVGYVVLVRFRSRDDAGAPSSPSGLSLDDRPLGRPHAFLAKTFQAVGESVPPSRERTEPLRKRLVMAGYRWPTAVAIFHGVKVASALGFAGCAGWAVLLFRWDSQATLIPALCAAGFGYLLPDRVLQRKVRARAQAIRRGLPAAMDLLVLAVEAGQSLDQSVLDVAKALSDPYPELCEELLFFNLEVRAGNSRAEALRHLKERSPEPELRKAVDVLLDGDRYGTSLGPALRTHCRYLRTRVRHSAQERARKLTVKLTLPTFFLIFPAVLAVTLGPAYLQLRESLSRLLEGM